MTARPAYVWDGSEWVPVGPTTAESPFYYQATPPTSPSSGDVWVDSDGDVDSIVTNAGDFATQSDLSTGLSSKADLASPTFTGNVSLPATTDYDGTQLSTTLASKGDISTNGAWTSWTPTFSQSGAVSVSVNKASYVQIGKMVMASLDVAFSSAGTSGNLLLLTSLPVAAAAGSIVIGNGNLYDSGSSTNYNYLFRRVNDTNIRLIGDWSGANGWGVTPSLAIASGDICRGILNYEAA